MQSTLVYLRQDQDYGELDEKESVEDDLVVGEVFSERLSRNVWAFGEWNWADEASQAVDY